MDPGRFPKARTGIHQNGGGFGFGGPSEAWLRANGQLPNQFTGSSSAIGQSENITAEEKEQRRLKAIERFQNPGEEIKYAQVTPPTVKKPQISAEERARREEIAQKREANLILNQMELDNTEILPAESAPVRSFDPEMRQKCLSGINLKPRRVEIEIPAMQITLNLENLLNSPESDFFLLTEDGTRIGVHKVILSARSLFFHTMLTSNSIEAVRGELQVGGFSGRVLTFLIRYLYAGQVKVSSQDIVELLYLADFFKIDCLKIVIEQKLQECVDVDNVIMLWELSEEMRLEGLKRELWAYCKKNNEVRKIAKDMPSQMKKVYYNIIKQG